jgi:hypothetical protein
MYCYKEACYYISNAVEQILFGAQFIRMTVATEFIVFIYFLFISLSLSCLCDTLTIEIMVHAPHLVNRRCTVTQHSPLPSLLLSTRDGVGRCGT